MERPPRPDHPLEYSPEERLALIVLMIVCALVVAVVNYWPAAPPEALSPEERELYASRIEDFVRASRATSDSIAAAKEARRAAYAERQAEWDRKRAGWAREKEERAARRAASRSDARSGSDGRGYDGRGYDRRGGTSRRRPESTRTAIDHTVPLPAPGSLDANAVDSATLLRLGVPVAITARWLKYRRSGGRFRRPSDVGKLYGLPDSTAARLQPYFAATQAPVPQAPVPQAGERRLDINTATAEEFESLRGIGAYTAGKIVEYREWLGGYVSVDQLLEARGVRAENIEGLRDRLTVASGPAPSIRVNAAASFDEWRHPYLKWKKAKVLLAFREQHGPYGVPEDLLRTKVISEEELARLRPYLDFGI